MSDETNDNDGGAPGIPDTQKPEVKKSHKAKPKPETVEVPPCPEAEPRLGDKTPAVIAWWFKHHPEEAAAKYKGRKFQLPANDE